MKRKGSKPAEQSSKKKKKMEENSTKLNIGDPDNLLKSLLTPVNVDTFFVDHWEKKHLHLKRDDSGYYGKLFDLDTLYEILDDDEMDYETDINVCRYVDGKKEMLNEEGNATVESVKKKFEKEKATIQFHQPQRFVNTLWRMMENLEQYFGCIFGANCYITPPGAQGLAPHCDDVEVFIMQLAGKKSWKLYKPMDELSRHYSQDLGQSEIGDPVAELTLEEGDLLYFPRGTIHQAVAAGESHSTHITLSTYQNNSLGDLLSHAIKHCLEDAIDSDVEFRRGLPVNFLSYLGTGKNVSNYVKHEKENGAAEVESEVPGEDNRVVDLKEKMKFLLNRLADHLDLNVAADSLSEDYVASRLPPFAAENEEDDSKDETAPTLQTLIKIKHPNHVRLVIYSEDDSDEEEDDEDSMIEEDEMKEMEEAAPKKENRSSSKKGGPKTRNNSGNETAKGKSQKAAKEKSKSEDEDLENESDDEDESDDESLGPHVTVLHSCSNDRSNHMVGEVEESGIRFPLHFAHAIQYLLEQTNKFIRVKSLPLLDDADKEKLAVSLWSDGLLDLKS